MSDSGSEHSKMNASDVIDAGQAATLWGLFCERVHRSPDAVGYRNFDPTAKTWRDHSWRAIAERVDRFRAALAQEAVRPGNRIAILLPNGIDWVCLDLAAHASGLVVVGLYPHDTAASNASILGHSDACLILLDSEARWQSFGPFRPEFLSLERVWIRDAVAEPVVRPGEPIARRLADVLDKSKDVPPAHPALPSDLATLIYTSGTTGRPKGVMLSHRALLWNAQASAAIVPPLRSDIFLSVLPLAHAFERTVGYYLPMMGGCTVAYARSPNDLPEDLVAIRPTAMLGVPLLYQRMASAVRANTASNLIKRNLLRLAASIGWRRFEAAQHRARLGLAVRVVGRILDRLVAKPVLAALGGRLRVAISGGAPLDRDVSRLLIGLGVPLVEGYGLTEAAPVVASNALGDNLPGSVGRLLKSVEAKLSGESELLVRSPSTMMGYWKNDVETAHVLDAEGWLSTGDSAEIADGRIFIRGRLRELIVLSIGEKVNPNVVEAELTRDPLFSQALVVGDRHPFLVAIIVLNAGSWKRFAAENGLDLEEPNHPLSKIELLARVTALLSDLPRYAQVRALHLTLQPWTIEAGQLTPTLKIKRDVVVQLFAKEIDALYAQ
jgi:long-chain acyl-CoA synthetase